VRYQGKQVQQKFECAFAADSASITALAENVFSDPRRRLGAL
jgi:hypothetical protein